ncbi:unnamed protein product [Trichogramma brassicae]|uniref:CCHC-type domain-containing protein n=1 Tax=Trichogramma brassicae TaxID=86971 RepID=A0A6H5HWG4_9HYME|nr:unnamed protein product [Trichogramma brassicae]
MTQHFRYPTKEEAIIIDSINGISIHSYTIAVGTIVQPKNVRFVSRISMNRVCIYLTDKALVQELTDRTIEVEGHKLTIRPLVNHSKRMLISNVCPTITQEEIIQELNKLQVQPVSQITFVHSGLKNRGYENVFSFRRQVYVKANDIEKIPPKLEIEHDGMTYTLYFTTEKLTCFSCKEEGHIAKYCRNTEEPPRSTNKSVEVEHATEDIAAAAESLPLPTEEVAKTTASATTTKATEDNSLALMSKSLLASTTMKRQLSSPSPTKEKPPLQKDQTRKIYSVFSPKQPTEPATKRSKQIEQHPSLQEVKGNLEPARNYLETNKSLYPLDFNSLSVMLHQTYGASNVYTIVKKFTTDTEALSAMLSITKQLVTCNNLKQRIHRIIKKLADLDEPHVRRWQQERLRQAAINKLCPPWVETDPGYVPSCTENVFLDEQFSFSELNIALEDKNEKSAPGLDGTGFDIIKKLPIKLKLILLDIFNEMYTLEVYPEAWKEVFVFLIPKPGGQGLRPVSLTSCFCKLFETMMKNRLQWWAEVNDWIPKDQHGFRRGHSCVDNMTGLFLMVEGAFRRSRDVLTAFLDVEGAFDNVNVDILLERLASLGCTRRIVKFVQFVTRERLIFTEGATAAMRLCKGFADDVSVSVEAADPADGVVALESAIKTLGENLDIIGLGISPFKTKLIHFNDRNIQPGRQRIKIREHVVSSCSHTKFLGVIFDYRLSFKEHINYVKKKCTSTMNIMKFLCGTYWGSHPDTLLILYKSYIRSIMDYGSFIYLPKNKQDKLKLERIQFAAIRCALGYRMSTPTNILLAEAKMFSFEERTKMLGKAYIAKALSNSNFEVTLKIEEFYAAHGGRRLPNRCLFTCMASIYNAETRVHSSRRFNPYNHNYHTLTFTAETDASLGHEIKNSPDPDLALCERLEAEQTLPVYTDGSAGRQKSISTNLGHKERLASYENNNPGKKVSLLWIPSHIGIVGNEVVDAVAKEATRNQPPNPAFAPFSDLSENFALEAKNNSNDKNMDEGRDKGKQYFEEFYSTRSTPWFSNVNLPRRHIVMINRMRANHTCLAESLERKNIIPDSRCRCGYEKENLNHILWDCRLYQTQRKVLLEKLKKIGLFPPLNVERLIACPTIEACTILCDYFIGLGSASLTMAVRSRGPKSESK